MQVNALPNDPLLAPGRPDRVRRVAQEFESIFVSMLLRSMRKTVGEDPLVPRGFGERVYTEMLDDQYAGQIAAHAKLGLADLIVKQLQADPSHLSALDRAGLRSPAWEFDKELIPLEQAARGRPRATDPAALYRRVSRWDSCIDEAAATYGVDRDLIAAVIARESGGDPQAVSVAGAKGLMQLMDSTAASRNVADVFDPRTNILAGTGYLKDMLDLHNGNEVFALAAYNAGPSAVDRYRGVPPYRETQDYVASVRYLRGRFAALREPDGEK